jgi:tetratricopeptide (TPR) repeat protein
MKDSPPARPTFRRTLIELCIGGIIGAVIAYVGLTSIATSGIAGLPRLLWFLASIFISLFFTIIIHECGHLAAALSQGFRFRVLTLGPLAMIDMPNGLRFEWNFRVMALIMGQQISTPPAKTATSPGPSVKNYLVYLMGGGIANLLSAALAGLLLVWMPDAPWLKQFLVTFIVVSVALGVVNLAPITMASGIKTDGFHMRALRRGDGGAAYFLAIFDYIRDVYEGVHPRDWSTDTLQRLEEHAGQDLERAIAYVMRLARAMALNDHACGARAAESLESVYASVPKAMRTPYAAELVYYFSMFERDAERVSRYAEDARRIGYLGSPATPVRVAACVAFVEGRYDNAVKLCEQAIALAPLGLNALDRLMEVEMAQDVIRRAHQKTSQPQVAPAEALRSAK